MTRNALPEVDPSQLESFRECLRQRAKHPFRLVATAFLRHGLVAFLLVFVVLPFLMGERPFGDTLTGRQTLIMAIAGVMMAAFSTLLVYRGTRDTLEASLQEHQQLLLTDWKRWVGIGWLRRTLKVGVLITVAVGIPVGLLMALTLPVPELPAGSRPLMLVTFVGLTALWAIPMGFAIRWYVLRDYRTLVSSPPRKALR